MKGRSKVHASASTSEPMTTTLTGEATASGDNTRVTGSLTGAATDDGLVSVTTGEAVFTATAQSPTGEVTAATADTSADSSGEDLLLTSTSSSSETADSGGLTTTTATSTTSVVALDEEPLPLLDVEAEENPLELEDIEGNFATFTGEAEAEGDDTYVVMDAALQVGDELSSVSATIFAIA